MGIIVDYISGLDEDDLRELFHIVSYYQHGLNNEEVLNYILDYDNKTDSMVMLAANIIFYRLDSSCVDCWYNNPVSLEMKVPNEFEMFVGYKNPLPPYGHRVNITSCFAVCNNNDKIIILVPYIKRYVMGLEEIMKSLQTLLNVCECSFPLSNLLSLDWVRELLGKLGRTDRIQQPKEEETCR